MGINDREKARALQELSELRKKSASSSEIDKTLNTALTKMRDEVREYDAKYDEQVKKKKEAFEKKSFRNTWDPKLKEALEIIRKPLQAYGENCEKAAAKLLKALEKGLENGASDYQLNRCADAALGALSNAENRTINIYQISKNLKYQPTCEGKNIKRSLERLKKNLPDGTGTIESQIKSLEKKLQRIEKADRYDVTLDILDTHESYLTAVKNYEKAVTGKQLRASAAEFKALRNYLNSKILFDESNRRALVAEEVERAEKAVSDAKTALVAAEKERNNAISERIICESALKDAEAAQQATEESTDHEKAAALEERNRKCAENDETVARLTEELDALVKQKSDAEFGLNKTFVLALGKKKEFKARIDHLAASISTKEGEIENTKREKENILRVYENVLSEADGRVAVARNQAQDASVRLEAANRKAQETDTAMEAARASLEKANQNYTTVIAKKKEKDAAIETEIKERKAKEAAAEEARKNAVLEVQKKGSDIKPNNPEERAEVNITAITPGHKPNAQPEAMPEEGSVAAVSREFSADADGAAYRPGKEPESIRRRLDTLFAKLDAAYPDKVVIGLFADHKKWGETVTELYRKLGYDNSAAFLNAYGYKVAAKGKTGRPSSVDPAGIVAFLRDKYADGPVFEKMGDLIDDTPELAGNFKTLTNRSNELFGTSLKDYFVQQGILSDGSERREKEREDVARQKELARQNKLNAKQAEKDRIAAAKKEHEDSIKKITEELMSSCGIEFLNVPFAITGLRDSVKYSLALMIKARGGLFRETVTGKTRFLIASNESQTVNYQLALKYQAQGLNIVILNEKQFYEATAKYDAYTASTDVLERAYQFIKTPDDPTALGLAVQGDTLTAFRGSEKEIKIPDGVKIIGNNSFTGSRVESISMPDSVIEIEENAFRNCKMLSKIKWSANLQSIGDQAFEYCKRLAELDLTKLGSLDRIGKHAFAHCYSLKMIKLPDSVKTVDDGCFEKCVQIREESLKTPAGLDYLADDAFRDCISLKNHPAKGTPNASPPPVLAGAPSSEVSEAADSSREVKEASPETVSSSSESDAEVSGDIVPLEENDISLERVHFDSENTMVVVAYRIRPEKLRPRFGTAIKKYETETGRSNNQCVLLAIIGDFSEYKTIPTFYSMLVFLDRYTQDWFEGDWFDSEKYLCDECTDLLDSEEFVFETADKDFEKEYGMDIGSYLDQFLPGIDLSAWDNL